METINIYQLPVVALRGMVVLPGMPVAFEVGRPQSVKAVEKAMEGDKRLFLTAQPDENEEKIETSNIYRVGTIARIEQVLHMHGGSARIVAEGFSRGILRQVQSEEPYISGSVEVIKTVPPEEKDENDAYCQYLKRIFEEYSSMEPGMTPDKIMEIIPERLCGRLADKLVNTIECEAEQKQEVLETFDDLKRAHRAAVILKNALEILHIERDIGVKVKRAIDKNQREYYLHQQMKIIEQELGSKEGIGAEADRYRKDIKDLKLDERTEKKLLKEADRLVKYGGNSSEAGVIRTYLDTVLELPWRKETKEETDLLNAQEILDEDHYGLEKVKERVIEYLAVRHFNKDTGSIICFVGPPGVGKTSVAKSIARALNKKYVRISLGGIHDEADIRGHRRTYIGSMPGRIMAAMAQAGTKNPLILLDEVDKMGSDYRGDPSAALLEVLDFEQNKAFRDHYIEVDFDLSDVMFVTTANTLDTVSRPLLDRMEVIELSGYTREEKMNIASRYLVPKALKKTGLKRSAVQFSEGALFEIIDYYTREAGVRKLEQRIETVCRRAAKVFITEKKKSLKITEKTLKKYLDKRIYNIDMMNERDEIGVVRGLAWTAAGGDTLSVEVNVMEGTGKTEFTGKLGDVMQESAKAAISYIRANSRELGIESDFYKTKDIHIHVPEGAVPKDGPSAGITMATAVVSALTKTPVRHDLAMTGEITIRGRVLPIGGLKEKSLAAYRAGIRTIIIPEENGRDVGDVPEDIRREIKFVTAASMNDVLKNAVVRNGGQTD